MMRRIFFILQIFICLGCFGYFNPVSLDVLPPEVKDFLDDYRRNMMSEIFARTSDVSLNNYSNEQQKKYFHDMFYVDEESIYDPVIYIFSNEYSISSVKLVKNEEIEYADYRNNKVVKMMNEDQYIIGTTEKMVGAIYAGNIDYSTSSLYEFARNKGTATEYHYSYSIYITADGPRVESQAKFPQVCVLERDVPLLLEKIDGLEEYHRMNQQNVYPYNRNDKFVVEWWYK
jgi:hypothetical protein